MRYFLAIFILFLSLFFSDRGETKNRWQNDPHALSAVVQDVFTAHAWDEPPAEKIDKLHGGNQLKSREQRAFGGMAHTSFPFALTPFPQQESTIIFHDIAHLSLSRLLIFPNHYFW